MIQNIIAKEFVQDNSCLDIAWTPCEDPLFENFFRTVCSPCNIVELNKTYYGSINITLIVCNNRIISLDKSIELAKFLLCPILIVDHSMKSDIISNNINNKYFIEPIYSVALSEDIYLSWNRSHDNVLPYNIHDKNNKDIWKNLILQLCKTNLKIKDHE